jgi:WD40 repeat protein
MDTTRGTVRARLRTSTAAAEGSIRALALAFAPGGRELAVGTPQGAIELWALDDPSEPLLRLTGHRASVTALAFDANDRHLASGGADQLVEVWDLTRIRAELDRLGLGW